MRLGSNIVITGASSGLGRQLALNYAGSGVFLGLIGRDRARLEQTATDCRAKGAQVVTAIMDVADAVELEPWLRSYDAEGAVDLLIANAGILAGPQDSFGLDGLESATRQVLTNLVGVINAVETLAPAMIARRAGQIAVIASTSAYRGLPFMPAYAASKAGVRIYGESLRARLAPLGVAVSVVVPSFFETPMTDRFQGAKPLMLSTAAAAARVQRGLDRRQGRIVFPRRIGLLMQILDLIPASLGDAILRGSLVHIDPIQPDLEGSLD